MFKNILFTYLTERGEKEIERDNEYISKGSGT